MSPGATSMTIALVLSGAMSLAALGTKTPAPEVPVELDGGRLIWAPEVHWLGTGRYVKQEATNDGWLVSPATGVRMHSQERRCVVQRGTDESTRSVLP